MKKYFKALVLFPLLLVSFCILPQLSTAQGTPPDPSCPGDTDNPPCPVDGGVYILIAAGVAIGLKKIQEERNKTFNNLKN